MREEDLQLDLGQDESTLEVKGVREPSREEEIAMRRQLQVTNNNLLKLGGSDCFSVRCI